ncbi:hypothetical protein [Shewanella frigidimarina]|uniref:hypothetical protein n=1 Tax=Shewanella frigidimarina TaxID=56812 RepID=UPI003D7AFF0E
MHILFLCTANVHRSRSAEDFFKAQSNSHIFKSAGLSEKYCTKYGSTLCTLELLEWADKVFVMEPQHKKRILDYAGERYLQKVEVLDIDDIYQYMQPELLELFQLDTKLKCLQT